MWEKPEYRHIYPLNDMREHETDKPGCWCDPDEINGVYIHHSLDRREDYETGKRKYN